MALNRMRSVLSHLRWTAEVRGETAAKDSELLDAFLRERDELAMEALIRRHGPMVMGVCRRVLGASHDAEDAFQATFLVLVRKGHTLRQANLLGNWLYGVAYRCSLEIRSANHRRRANEKQVQAMPEPAMSQNNNFEDVRPVLDRELDQLPDKYRAVVILCDLEGRQRREVARQLGLAEGTLSSRLATARRMLAKRLERCGVSLSAGFLAAILSQQAQAAVPSTVAQATLHAAGQLAAGQALTSLAVSAQVIRAFKGVMQAMFLAKLKIPTALLLLTGLVAGVVAQSFVATAPPAAPKEQPKEAVEAKAAAPLCDYLQSRPWTLKAIDPDQKTISITDRPRPLGGFRLIFGADNGPKKPPEQKGATLEGLPLAKNVKVIVDGQPGKFADLKEDMTLILKTVPNKTLIAEIQVLSRPIEDQYTVEAVNLKKNTITLKVQDATTVELPLAKDAKLIVQMIILGADPEPQNVEGKVAEIARGTPVHLKMAMEGDRLVVRTIRMSQ